MKDQYKKIKGYRDLTQVEIDAMNAIKEKAAEVGILIEELQDNKDFDQRWIEVAKTDLQKGFMAAARGVGRLESF